MKTPYNCRMGKAVLIIAMSVLLFFFAGYALASSGGEGAAEPKGWVKTDTYRVMNFVVLAIALFLVLKKPVSQALGSRIKGIENQLADLEARKKDAEKELAGYEEKLSLLEKESGEIIDEYIRQGKEAQKKILGEAQASAEKLEEQARKTIDHEFQKAKEKLQADILDKAMLKAEALLKEKISTEDQDKLVDEYLNKVVA
jgi:F-type H+-transporting ATPase subunit b